MGSIELDRFGCFGKLPVSREFLVERTMELTTSGFDSWISEGMALARSPLGGAFKERATHFPTYRFVWSGRVRHAGGLVGQLVPGQDAAGRVHPFSVFAVLHPDQTQSADPTEAFRLAALQATLATALEEARAAEDPASLTNRIRALRGELPRGSEYEAAEYRRFLEARSGGDFWTAVFGEPQPPLRYQVVQALYETVEYLRERPASDIRMGIRFPLPKGPAILEIAFWIDLTARIFRGSLDGCCYFWTDASIEPCRPIAADASPGDPAADDWSPNLLFFFSPPNTAQLSALIDPQAQVESISFLERPYGGPPEERMDAELRAILDNPAAPLRTLIDWAGRS